MAILGVDQMSVMEDVQGGVPRPGSCASGIGRLRNVSSTPSKHVYYTRLTAPGTGFDMPH